MRNKSKLKIIILVLGIVFALSPINSFKIINDQGENEGTTENRDETNFKRLKSSGYWSTNFIHVDGNWSHTVGNYSWCSGDGSWSTPYTIENVTIDASTSPTGSGILIDNSKNDYFAIRNCTIFNAWGADYYADEYGGIKLENTNNGTLSNNTCFNNLFNGILLSNNCINNTISGNMVTNIGTSNQEIGILFLNYCDKNTISGNTANDNDGHGILLYNSDNNTVSENTAKYNDAGGIYLYRSNYTTVSGNVANENGFYGMLLDELSQNVISGNIINENGDSGILMGLAHNNIISGNFVSENFRGMDLQGNSDDNTITENFVFRNNRGIVLSISCGDNLIYYNYLNNSVWNAVDDGAFPNYWDSGIVGNYWSNYLGIDANLDGIGDSSHDIPGTGGRKDNRPLMYYNPFFSKTPEDMTYEIGTDGHSLVWTVWTPALLSYNIFRDDIVQPIKSGRLLTIIANVEIPVDNLAEDVYRFTIEVEDLSGRISIDGVWVTVTNTAPEFTVKPYDMSYEVGGEGNNISWVFSDISMDNPSYTITRDGLPIISSNPCFSGEPIEILVDGLEIGSHVFNIEINDGYGGTVSDSVWVIVIKSGLNPLYVDIIEQSFSTVEFDLIFSVYNESGQGIDFPTINMWWDGTDVSTSIQNLGSGLFIISLEPITVAPGEDPILLTMTISASGYQDKYFETYIAVDPDTLNKGKPAEEFPLALAIIVISSIVGGIGIAVMSILILRKRKRPNEVL